VHGIMNKNAVNCELHLICERLRYSAMADAQIS